MADPVLDPIHPALAARLDLLEPPALSADFVARMLAAAQATAQQPVAPALPPIRAPHGPVGRWRAIGRRARLGIAAGGLALAGLGSVSAAAAGLLGEPVNHAVHKLPVVGKLIEKVIPEKRHRHHEETAHEAGLRRAPIRYEHGLRSEARPAVADAPPLVAPGPPQPVIAVPSAGLGLRSRPPWVYPGPLPRTFPPGPERQAAIASFRAFRAAHPLPLEVIARRQRRAAIMAGRRAFEGGQAVPLPRRFAPPPDPFATTVPPGAVAPRPDGFAPPPVAAPRFGQRLDPAERAQLRIERRRARIEAWRAGHDPMQPGPGRWRARGFDGPGHPPFPERRWRPGPGFHPHPPGGFGGGGRRFRG